VTTSIEQPKAASYPKKLERQHQEPPGRESALHPKADHGEETYRGSGKLTGRVAVITGADSGIGKAVAIAFAREGADIAISYLEEQDDAEDTACWVSKAGRRSFLYPGDLAEESVCQELVRKTVAEFGRLDILVCNAAFQMSREKLEDISSEEWDKTFRTNIYSIFYLTKTAVPHMSAGGAIIATSSVNLDAPKPTLLPYAATKAAIQNYMGNLAQLLAEKGIRANTVAPGPIWTPLIPSTMSPEDVEKFGQSVPMKRPGQPAELAPVYVLLASPEASYLSGATIAVTGGKPVI
jgi:NAD(P)-dependent dehydrogenase (short-subunit alcohol dehydrogenase family)